MLMLDVNVLVHAHRVELPDHASIRQWLTDLVNSGRPFGVPELAFSGFIRIVTQSKPWRKPSTTAEAIGFCRSIMAAPRCLVVRPSERHWGVFESLCQATQARGNLVPDAYFAAFALDSDCEWITTDRDFSRFPGLRWRHPLERHARTNPA